MKKIIMALMCLAVAGGMSAQKKVVDSANKLVGKPDKLTEARGLINEAINNPETANDPRTYYVAGMIEWKAYDADRLNKDMGKPTMSTDTEMAAQMLNGYKYLTKALELDAVPDAKGKTGAYATKIYNELAGHDKEFWTAGATYYNEKKFYPEAFEGFYTAAEIPAINGINPKAVTLLPDSTRMQAYFYAGQSAYSGKALESAIKAFEKAAQLGMDDPNVYVYQLASWEAIGDQDSTRKVEAGNKMNEVSMAGFKKFGINPNIFLSRLVENYAEQNRLDQALELLNTQITENPNAAILYRLRGWVNGKMEKEDALVDDYLKAGSMADADADILYNCANVIYRYVANKNGALEINDPNAKTIRENLKNNFLQPALEFANKAKQLNQGEKANKALAGKINNLLDDIDYLLPKL